MDDTAPSTQIVTRSTFAPNLVVPRSPTEIPSSTNTNTHTMSASVRILTTVVI